VEWIDRRFDELARVLDALDRLQGRESVRLVDSAGN